MGKEYDTFDGTLTIRDTKIDVIRGLAAIFVILGHGIGLLVSKGNLDSNIGYKIFDIIYTFHMPLFFMISGFSYRVVKNKKLLQVILKDLVSLYIPYLFLNYLYLFEKFVAEDVLKITLDKSLRATVWNIIELLYMGDNITWFLLSLLCIKISFNILNKYLPETISLIFYMLIFWLSYYYDNYYLGWGIFYYLGYIINKYSLDKFIGEKRKIVIILCINIVIFGLLLLEKIGLCSLVKITVGIPIFIMLILLLQNVPKIKVISFCGEYSMVVYIIHGLSQFISYMILSEFITSSFLLVTSMVIIQILFAYTIYIIS